LIVFVSTLSGTKSGAGHLCSRQKLYNPPSPLEEALDEVKFVYGRLVAGRIPKQRDLSITFAAMDISPQHSATANSPSFSTVVDVRVVAGRL